MTQLLINQLISLLGLLALLREPAPASQAPVPAAGSSGYGRLLLGTWQSLDDPRFTVSISPSAYTEHYQKTASSLRYRLASACQCDAGAATKAASRHLLVTYETSPQDCYCYSIDQLDQQHLTLLYLGRGNSLRFRRVSPARPL